MFYKVIISVYICRLVEILIAMFTRSFYHLLQSVFQIFGSPLSSICCVVLPDVSIQYYGCGLKLVIRLSPFYPFIFFNFVVGLDPVINMCYSYISEAFVHSHLQVMVPPSYLFSIVLMGSRYFVGNHIICYNIISAIFNL